MGENKAIGERMPMTSPIFLHIISLFLVNFYIPVLN